MSADSSAEQAGGDSKAARRIQPVAVTPAPNLLTETRHARAASAKPLSIDRDTASLLSEESNGMAASLVFHLCGLINARAVIIKGASLVAHGLRGGYSSADIDVIVEPSRGPDLVAALRYCGWDLRPTTLVDRRTAYHSITLLHRSWPTDIDVHLTYPGLMTTPESAFETIWQGRVSMVLGGTRCWIPDRASTIVIWALHSQRGSYRQTRHSEELAALLTQVIPALDGDELTELRERASSLGATSALQAIPEFAEILRGQKPEPSRHDALWRHQDALWRHKVAQARGAPPWPSILLEARPIELPWLLFRAIWPSASDLRLANPELVDSRVGRSLYRARRAFRIACSLLRPPSDRGSGISLRR